MDSKMTKYTTKKLAQALENFRPGPMDHYLNEAAARLRELEAERDVLQDSLRKCQDDYFQARQVAHELQRRIDSAPRPVRNRDCGKEPLNEFFDKYLEWYNTDGPGRDEND